MAEKDSASLETQHDEQDPPEMAFDFEDLLAAAVAVVTLKRPRKRKTFNRRDAYRD
jgi:hypothetical protein